MAKDEGRHAKRRWRTFDGRTVYAIAVIDPGNYVGKHRKEG